MIYFIQAKVTIKVFGISGPFVDQITQLVNASSTQQAKAKFEAYVRKRYGHMQAESIDFEYLTFADTI